MNAAGMDPSHIWVTLLALLVVGRALAPWCGVRPVAVRRAPLYRYSTGLSAGQRTAPAPRCPCGTPLVTVVSSTW